MAVTVRFVDRTERHFDAATSASLDGPIFHVTKWNPIKRKVEDVEILPADQVTVAEVSDHSGVTERILGLGRCPAN